MITGYYYLHTNGALIYKRALDGTAADLRESTFCRSFWPLDPTDRESAWSILVEALSIGAEPSRVDELAALWQCNDADAIHYAKRLGLRLYKDGTAWCATRADFSDLQTSPAGFGDTALKAFAALCSDLGFTGRRLWGHTFATLANA